MAELLSRLYRLVNQRCSGYVGGRPTGSIITLDFAGSGPTPKRPTSTGLSSLMIWCGWRLEDQYGVICDWNDSNEKGGPMLRGLDQIVGRVVTAIDVTSPAWDLVMTFGNSLRLHVFCDQCRNEKCCEDYVLFAE